MRYQENQKKLNHVQLIINACTANEATQKRKGLRSRTARERPVQQRSSFPAPRSRQWLLYPVMHTILQQPTEEKHLVTLSLEKYSTLILQSADDTENGFPYLTQPALCVRSYVLLTI